tara:strand:+ start:380 stop:1141 length:762 start_codon:yes stop_codon:yes gene_type:complete
MTQEPHESGEDRSRILLAIPVYNEAKYIEPVLSEVGKYARDILVVDDGSTDDTPLLLAKHRVEVIRHAVNRGYGRSITDMLRWADFDGYDWLITMDCDEQHEPAAIPEFIDAIETMDADVISGSRYLVTEENSDTPPADRRAINGIITDEINQLLGFKLTDAFCGFKAYRIASCKALSLDITGYEFPMQFWVQAAAHDLRIAEIPVRLIYNDPTRSFGGPLDQSDNRLASYRSTIQREVNRCSNTLPMLKLNG